MMWTDTSAVFEKAWAILMAHETRQQATGGRPAGERIKRVHIVGKKNSGKTTLVCDLVTLLTKQGYSVATIKHTHHNHELDTTGKDSWQHRQAGATSVGILASEMTAVFLPVVRSQNEAERYAVLETTLAGCDLIIVEGDLHCDAPKLEVWRKATSDAPYAATTSGINFVVTDDALDQDSKAHSKTIPRSDLNQIATTLLKLTQP